MPYFCRFIVGLFNADTQWISNVSFFLKPRQFKKRFSPPKQQWYVGVCVCVFVRCVPIHSFVCLLGYLVGKCVSIFITTLSLFFVSYPLSVKSSIFLIVSFIHPVLPSSPILASSCPSVALFTHLFPPQGHLAGNRVHPSHVPTCRVVVVVVQSPESEWSSEG